MLFNGGKDTQTVQLALPAHMLSLMGCLVQKGDFELRPDFHTHLNRAAAVPFADMDPVAIHRCAKKTDDAAVALLRDLNLDTPVQALVACAYFVLTLVEEGLFPDPRNQAVLAALLVIEDAREFQEDWEYNEASLKRQSQAMLSRANLLGLYVKILATQSLMYDAETIDQNQGG